MKNAENANYTQNDHQANILKTDGVEILKSKSAWEKYEWSRKYFLEKPEEGYFIHVKKQTNLPILTCVNILSKDVQQKLSNLVVVEKNLNIELRGTCTSLKRNLCGGHNARGKIVLREGSSLRYKHITSWDRKDVVETCYGFLLEKNSGLNYTYKILSMPGKLKINTKVFCSGNSSANLKIVGDCRDSEIEINDSLILKEKNSSGVLKLRLVGRKNSKIFACSKILADSECRGHLDCQGLLIDEDSEISLTPELICKNRQAQLTHEASIGKISEEELYYLRSRGLNEQEAIDLIINGFLE